MLTTLISLISYNFILHTTFLLFFVFFFFNDTATTEIYTLSLHDALPISNDYEAARRKNDDCLLPNSFCLWTSSLESRRRPCGLRSEEHTSELLSRLHLVCRLLLEKKKKNKR